MTPESNALVVLSRWRIWRKNDTFVLGHATDGDEPTHDEWVMIGDALIALDAERETVRRLEAQVKRMREALQEISEGKGRFSRDHFEHCRNTVEDMKALAVAALSGSPNA